MADKTQTDEQAGPESAPLELSQMGATFAERKAAREKAASKMVGSAENKQVTSSEARGRRRK